MPERNLDFAARRVLHEGAAGVSVERHDHTDEVMRRPLDRLELLRHWALLGKLFSGSENIVINFKTATARPDATHFPPVLLRYPFDIGVLVRRIASVAFMQDNE